ncbi:hypothetical protein [Stutzerimonas kunmingensis]|uniref:hypothetical protein n=1 Tax=Stutzerimonas kunmingensis TaxID=1211807 RepID=UPI00210256FC|nr:hypothetical protein [Stutzerimonas kunmingensis]MCQ2036563.1 hypothetical protein [Stutzerimonas kunmingensis]
MANKFSNRKAKQFLLELDRDTIETSDIFTRSKFNFSFFDPNQNHCADFAQLSPNQLLETFEKIRHYSRSPLTYWQTKRCGGGGLKILEIYGDFPKNSDFTHPKHVPHDVKWARFRMDNLGRLVGFVVPPELVNLASEDRKFFLDTNTFYVVFIDLDHRFYKTENR